MNKLYNDYHKDTFSELSQRNNPVLFQKRIQIDQFRCQHYQLLVNTASMLLEGEREIEKYALLKFINKGNGDLDDGEAEHFHNILNDKGSMPTEVLSQVSKDNDYIEWLRLFSELELDFIRRTKLKLAFYVKRREVLKKQQQSFDVYVTLNCKPLGISTNGQMHFYSENDGSYYLVYEPYELEFLDQRAETSDNVANFLASLYSAGIKKLDLTAPELVVQSKQQYENGALSLFN